jgi:hypothetical protein
MARVGEVEQQRPTVQHQEANNLRIDAKAHWEGVLAYNLTCVINIFGPGRLIAAIRT